MAILGISVATNVAVKAILLNTTAQHSFTQTM